MIAVKY